MPKTTTKPDRLKQAHDKLQAAVESIVTSEESGTLTCSFLGISLGTWADGRFPTVVDFEGVTSEG